MPAVAFSSTEIRERVKAGKSVNTVLPCNLVIAKYIPVTLLAQNMVRIQNPGLIFLTAYRTVIKIQNLLSFNSFKNVFKNPFFYRRKRIADKRNVLIQKARINANLIWQKLADFSHHVTELIFQRSVFVLFH